MEISKYISRLLFEHDYVVIPEFGGFVANYHPATIHPVQHRFDPPSKSILFNASLTINDGLLVSHIAEAEKIGFEEATERIKAFVLQIRQTIAEGQKVTFENLGVLYADTSGNITFDQHKTVNYLPEVYGMDSFVSPAISRRIKRPAVIAPKPQFDIPESKVKNRLPIVMLRVAAGISIVFILSFLGYSFLPDNNSLTTITGFLPTKDISQTNNHSNHIKVMPETALPTNQSSFAAIDSEPETTIDEANAETDPEIKTFEETASEDTKEETLPTVVAEEKTVTTPPPSPAQAKAKMYHLIAGSFLENENADNLIAFYEDNGYTPALIGPSANGYFRVSIAAYLRKNEALEELNLVRDKFNPNVWLLRQ